MNHVSRRKHYWIAGVALTLIALALINYHWSKFGLDSHWHVIVNSLACLSLLGQLAMAHLNKDFDAEETDENRENVVVVVPVYNEDPITFRAMLESLSAQTRHPDFVYVVDDGSESDECRGAFDEWSDGTIPAKFVRQENAGKREAQAVAFRDTPESTLYCTVDSDTVLDPRAIEEIMKPFLADARVQSVAGLLLGLNYSKNLLTRLVDVGFVGSFLNGRASYSLLGSVVVNCGGLAAYRGSVIRKHLSEYIEQTVGGKRVACGDDRILTNFALLEGRAVFQSSACGFTMHPERLGHLQRQRVRWAKSFWWGSEWLSRRLSPKRAAWWLTVGQIADVVVFSLVLVTTVPLILYSAVTHYGLSPLMLCAYLAGLGLFRNMRYLSIQRPDQTFGQQVRIWLLSPLVVALNFYIVTILMYVGLATVRRSDGWSTRTQGVEVRLASE